MVITVAPALRGAIDSPSHVHRWTVMQNIIGLSVSIYNQILFYSSLFLYISLHSDFIISIYQIGVHVGGIHFAH